jgi:hypothetical protein
VKSQATVHLNLRSFWYWPSFSNGCRTCPSLEPRSSYYYVSSVGVLWISEY